MDLMKRYYDFRDFYFNGDYVEFEGEALKCEFINRFTMVQEFSWILRSPLIEIVKEHGHVKLNFYFDASIAEDGYEIEVTKEKIEVKSSTQRGLQYAVDALCSLIERDEKKIVVPLCEISDYPSFKIRGIIEGFYGEPWSFEDRMDMIAYQSQHRINSYIYAPKDDEYHRRLWREPYPEKEFSRICELKIACDSNLVDFYYCISPGNDIRFTSLEDINYVKEKFKAMISIGIRHFALLMDDIDYVLKGEYKNIFNRSGIAHSYLTNEINRFLKEELSEYKLVMCPSEYWENWDSEYRRDLRQNLDEEILVYWTGYNTIAKKIDKKDAEIVEKSFDRGLVLWDNVPVNDVDKDRIFLSPLRTRYSKLNNFNHIGVVSNPMIQWQLSKITLTTFSHFMWNSEKYNPEYSWELSIKEFAGEHYEAMRFFCENNENSRVYNTEDRKLNKAVEIRDLKYLSNYFVNFEKSIASIRKIDNKKFQEEIKHWLLRAEFDIELWKLICEAEESKASRVIDRIKEKLEEIKEKQHKIGRDLAVKIASSWGY